MFEGVDARLGRIADKLAAVQAMPVLPAAFGAENHRFELRPPLTEAEVAAFEARHEVTLPQPYRSFITELGDGGAGPGYEVHRLADACDKSCRPGHLARASPYLPGPRYRDDWEERYEVPPSEDRIFLPGTLQIASHGCSLGTRLVVTGPARGRLFNLDYEGPVGPYIVEDPDFLSWYERWLDEAVAGYDVGWFGERLPLEEPELIAALADDPSPARRLRAGTSLLELPAVSEAAWAALAQAVATDADPTVRATLLDKLTRQRIDTQRRPHPAQAATDQVVHYARSCAPPDLRALAVLDKLTLDDLLPDLVSHDIERRRSAAYLLGRDFRGISSADVPGAVLDTVVGELLNDVDFLVRSQGVWAVQRFGLTRLHPVLEDLQQRETDPWVLFALKVWLFKHPLSREDPSDPWAPDPWTSATADGPVTST
ncbi:SMI1/KNR4 family protein [Catellatospora sp. NPDC049111]|uniref:SMI1/KNR4 family protein n=1 Tax=Catellatospora sp. NPDC049111 TaxID=3155271 RepID=UPI003401FEEE